MSRVVHFEINSDNPHRALSFYQDVFGWTAEKWDGPEDYWLIKTGEDNAPGINGGLLKRPMPGLSTVNTVQVDSVNTF